MRSSFETLGSDVRKMLEQFMLKMESSGKVMGVEDSDSSEATEVMRKSPLVEESKKLNQAVLEPFTKGEASRVSTKYTKLKCPNFNGSDFRG